MIGDAQLLEKTLDSYVADFFCVIRLLPSEFEERLNGINNAPPVTLAEYQAITSDAWKIKFGHPTESLLHFFRSEYRIPTNILSTLSPPAWRNKFFVGLFRVLIDGMEECADMDTVVPHSSSPIEWQSPCERPGGCHALCRGLCNRVNTLQVAATIAKHNAAWKILNHVYAHIDSHMPFMCALDYLCSKTSCDEKTFRVLLTKARPNMQYAYTVENIPDTTVLDEDSATGIPSRV